MIAVVTSLAECLFLVDSRLRLGCAILGVGTLLSACAIQETIKVGKTEIGDGNQPAIVWPAVIYKERFFERLNHARVIAVDGQAPSLILPLELAKGMHEIKILHERDSFLCGYLGCVAFEQTVVSLPLDVEAGHTYIPVARKYCEKDWVWVVDKGATAESDVNDWQQNRIPLVLNLRAKDLVGLRVVAGATPPERCDSQ